MKSVTIGADRYLVSDAIAHHLSSYSLLALLPRPGLRGRVRGPALAVPEQVIVTLTLSRDTPIPIVTDYNGELSDPEDPDDLTDLLELEAFTVLSDKGAIYSFRGHQRAFLLARLRAVRIGH